jgi:hypothetical protein
MGVGWELLGGHGKIERGDLFGQYGLEEGVEESLCSMK